MVAKVTLEPTILEWQAWADLQLLESDTSQHADNRFDEGLSNSLWKEFVAIV